MSNITANITTIATQPASNLKFHKLMILLQVRGFNFRNRGFFCWFIRIIFKFKK